MRKVALAHVVVKLRDTDGGCYYLLHRHEKWGDWTLVGGHVEPGEEDLWAETARREAEEEMPPLRCHPGDFFLAPLLTSPLTWGPRNSRSAGGEPTVYKAQFFCMLFRRDPAPLLAALEEGGFMLIAESQLHQHEDIGDVLRQLEGHLVGGLASVPSAWTGPSVARLLQRFSSATRTDTG